MIKHLNHHRKKVTVYSKGDIIRFYTPGFRQYFELGNKIAQIPFIITRFQMATNGTHIKLHWN